MRQSQVHWLPRMSSKSPKTLHRTLCQHSFCCWLLQVISAPDKMACLSSWNRYPSGMLHLTVLVQILKSSYRMACRGMQQIIIPKRTSYKLLCFLGLVNQSRSSPDQWIVLHLSSVPIQLFGKKLA